MANGVTTPSEEEVTAEADACDAGTIRECSPAILAGVCPMCDGTGGGGLLAAFITGEEWKTICASCDFLSCCDEDGEGYEVCSGKLPEEIVLPGMAGEGVTTTVMATPPSVTTTGVEATTGVAESTSSATEETTSTSSTEVLAPLIASTTFPLTEEAETEEAESIDSTGSGIDDFWGTPLPDETGGLFDSESEEGGSDDFLSGLFGGGQSNQSPGQGMGDFMEGIGDFIGSLFGDGSGIDMNSTFNQTDDDFFNSLLGDGWNNSEGLGEIFSGQDDDFDWDTVFNETEDDFFGSILEGGLNNSVLGDLLESAGDLLGNWGGENGTDILSGWEQDDLFESSTMVCSEENTCPVAGFCDCMNGDLSKCTLTILEDVCSSGAMFSCSPDGFEEMCNKDCPPPSRRLQGGNAVVTAMETESYSSANCAMCQVARCCEAEGSTMTTCAMEAGIDPQAIMNLTDIGNTLEDFVDEVLNNLTGVIDDWIGNITVPEFCPSGSCPVDGFCECFQGDFMQCTEQVQREACEANAYFGECGPADFETFCSTECDGKMESMQDVIDVTYCSLCTIATCCQEKVSADECLFGGASEFVTDTSGSNEGNQPDSKEETEADGTDAQPDVVDIESIADGLADSSTEGKDEVDTVSSATAEEDGTSSASKLVLTVVYGILSLSALSFMF